MCAYAEAALICVAATIVYGYPVAATEGCRAVLVGLVGGLCTTPCKSVIAPTSSSIVAAIDRRIQHSSVAVAEGCSVAEKTAFALEVALGT